MADLEFETVGVKKRQPYSYKKNPSTKAIILELVQEHDIESRKIVPSKLWEEIAGQTREKLGQSHENVDKITGTSLKTFYRNLKKKDEEEGKDEKVQHHRVSGQIVEKSQSKPVQLNVTGMIENVPAEREKENNEEDSNQPSKEPCPTKTSNPKRRKSLGLPKTPIISNIQRENRFDIVDISDMEFATPHLSSCPEKLDENSTPIKLGPTKDKSKYFQSKEAPNTDAEELDQPDADVHTIIRNLKETPNRSGKIICYLCARAVTKLSEASKARHFEKCLLTAFNTVISPKYFKHPISKLLESLLQCPFCKSAWADSSEVKLMHLKSCIKHQDIATHSLLRYLKSLKAPEPEIKINAFELMKHTGIKKSKRTAENTKILDLQQQNAHIDNRKQLFLQKFQSKVHVDNQESNIKMSVLAEVESEGSRRKSTLWEMADNQNMEVESIPVLNQFSQSEAGQKLDISYPNILLFEKHTESPFMVKGSCPELQSSPSKCSPDPIKGFTAMEEQSCAREKKAPNSSIVNTVEDVDLKIISESKPISLKRQQVIDDLQSLISQKRKSLQNRINTMKAQFEAWTTSIEKQYNNAVGKIDDMDVNPEVIQEIMVELEVSTQTEPLKLSLSPIHLQEFVPDELLLNTKCESKFAEESSFYIHDYIPTAKSPGIYDYTPTVEFETVTLKKKPSGVSQDISFQDTAKKSSMLINEIVALESIDYPPSVKKLSFSKIEETEYCPPQPKLTFSSNQVDFPAILPALDYSVIYQIEIPPELLESQTITSCVDEVVIKPKNSYFRGLTKETGGCSFEGAIDLAISLNYEEQVSPESYADRFQDDKPSQVEILSNNTFARDFQDISNIYPEDIPSDSEVSEIEELISDVSNSPLLDRVPIELSLNSEDDMENDLDSEGKYEGRSIESVNSFKRRGGFYDDVGLISQGNFTQAETQNPNYSPNKKLKLEYEWSVDGFSDDNADNNSFDVELSIIPCTQMPNAEKPKPSVFFQQTSMNSSAKTSRQLPNYSAMSIGELKKLADSFGLKSNTGKRYLVDKLTEIWHVLNTEAQSPNKPTRSPTRGHSLKSPLKSQKKVQFQDFNDILMAHFKKDIELNKKIICFEVSII
ncbi:hypothetical protein HDV01_001811 [Terramyces sp. JEL0728]|nr:hypothetical protein HDV01_001811 [Terramyces sp. JEL0728]